MTTTLMKTCLLGMAGAMAVSLVACGNNSSSNGTPASTSVARSSTSVTASPTPVEHEQTKALKHLSQDDFTKAISSKKINNQTFTIVDNSQIAAQMNQITKVMSQAKISPAECGKILKQSISSVTGGGGINGDQHIDSVSDRKEDGGVRVLHLVLKGEGGGVRGITHS